MRQIELTLERWRWMPHQVPERYIVVNVPAFRLYAFDHDPSGEHPAAGMAVIVGKADHRHHTPLFSSVMREVVFRPYWDVPLSIARSELLPAIRRNPGYLDRESLEIVRDAGADAKVYAPTAANLAQVVKGTLRLRQRPGRNNALGLVKFLFPNRYNVYLHGTPAQQLFLKSRRDFSHGCIRVEDPPALVNYVLGSEAAWAPDSVTAAVQGTRTRVVSIPRPVTVFVLYATAVARPNGDTYFYADVYGHDHRLSEQLLKRRTSAD